MKCQHCREEKPDVEERWSYGIYAGKFCKACCKTYRDHCGTDLPQGDVTELDEFIAGGYDAIYGEDEQC